jgi:hypothetical protein
MKILMQTFKHHFRGEDFEVRVFEDGNPLCVLYYVEAYHQGKRITEPHVIRAYDAWDMKTNTRPVTVNGVVRRICDEIDNGTIGVAG